MTLPIPIVEVLVPSTVTATSDVQTATLSPDDPPTPAPPEQDAPTVPTGMIL